MKTNLLKVIYKKERKTNKHFFYIKSSIVVYKEKRRKVSKKGIGTMKNKKNSYS